MKKETNVSIVIPIYNVEKYLEDMLDCVTNQTMENIELICINDASTDRSLCILEQFAQRDKRLQIINNVTNQGAAVCRNIGLEKAKGVYICFLDSDDMYSKELLEKEYMAICKSNADVAVVHSVNFKGNLCDIDFKWNASEIWKKEQCISMEDGDRNWLMVWNVAPWNKMYRRSFINEYGLLFQDLTSSNDDYFGVMTVLLARKIVLVESAAPMVFHRTSVKTQISANRLSSNVYLALEKIHDAMVEWLIWNKYCEEYFELFYNVMLSEYKRCNNEEVNKKTYEYIAQEGLKKLGFFDLKNAQEKYYYCGLRKFVEYSYESIWLNDYGKFLERNTRKIICRLDEYRAEQKCVAIWGAGERAKAFIELVKKYGCFIEFLIDSDVTKHNKTLCNIKISIFKEISNLLDVIIVLNSLYYEEIVDTVSKLNQQVEVFNFEEYLLRW